MFACCSVNGAYFIDGKNDLHGKISSGLHVSGLPVNRSMNGSNVQV